MAWRSSPTISGGPRRRWRRCPSSGISRPPPPPPAQTSPPKIPPPPSGPPPHARATDQLIQAGEVSKAAGRPVKLIWPREEDIRSDRYRPQAALKMRAARRPDGSPAGLDFRTAVGSITRSLGWGEVESGVEPSAIEGLVNCPYPADALRVGVKLKNT